MSYQARAELQRAWAALEAGERAAARRHFDGIRDVALDDAASIQLFGAVAIKLGEAEAAKARLRRAVKLEPNEAQHRLLLALAHLASGERPAAKGALRQALKLRPAWADASYHLAQLLADDGEIARANALIDTAIAAQGDDADLWNQRGLLAAIAGDPAATLEAHRRAHSLAPDDPQIAFNLGTTLLQHGSFEEGWPLFETRLSFSPNLHPPENGSKLWRGESLEQASILIWNEQGLGDSIQFARYLPALGAGRTVLRCQAPLVDLLAPLADTTVADGEVLPETDFHLPMMSLASRLPEVPAPYLERPAERPTLPEGRLRVGLVWAGASDHAGDRRRSLRGSAFKPLCAVDGVVPIALQHGEASRQLRHPKLVTPPIGALDGFASTAAWFCAVDLVVSVDTAAAHLAGALGIPCWLLLGEDPDWRWGLSEETTPWYPSLRLFRSREVDEIAAELGRRSGDGSGT